MLRTRGLTHLALAVRDPAASLRFYERVLGVVAVYREDGFIQVQTPGSWDVLVFETNTERAGAAGGVVHFGFRLVDPADIGRAADAVVVTGSHASGTATPRTPPRRR